MEQCVSVSPGICVTNLVDQIEDEATSCVAIAQYTDGVLILCEDHVPNDDGELIVTAPSSH